MFEKTNKPIFVCTECNEIKTTVPIAEMYLKFEFSITLENNQFTTFSLYTYTRNLVDIYVHQHKWRRRRNVSRLNVPR